MKSVCNSVWVHYASDAVMYVYVRCQCNTHSTIVLHSWYILFTDVIMPLQVLQRKWSAAVSIQSQEGRGQRWFDGKRQEGRGQRWFDCKRQEGRGQRWFDCKLHCERSWFNATLSWWLWFDDGFWLCRWCTWTARTSQLVSHCRVFSAGSPSHQLRSYVIIFFISAHK